MNDSIILPEGLTKTAFAKAVEAFRGVVGADNVIVDLDRLVPYAKIMIPEDEKLHQPSAVIIPLSVEHVQSVVSLANQYKTPLWPISTGRNFGYGSAAPATAGQIVLDLRRMNKIIDVDPEMCTALVEPGVTYEQLRNYIEERKLPLWISFPSSGPIVGPVGNTLDRGVGYNRCGEHAANFCGLEVVLPNGELVRTAMGGVKGGSAWQAYRWGYGPWVDGLFAQSNLGIVTKMGLWLMRKPSASKTFTAVWNDLEGAAKGVNVLRNLRLNNVLENSLLGHLLYGVACDVPRNALYKGPGAIPDEVVAEIAKKAGAGIWNSLATLYGTEEQIAVNFKIVKEAFAPTGAIVLSEEEVGPNPVFQHWKGNMTGRPDLSEFGIYNFRGGGGSAWFAPLAPARSEDFKKQVELVKTTLAEFGFDYLGGFLIGGRHMEHVCELAFDRTDPEEMQRAYLCYDKLLQVNAAAGYAVYRTNTAFMNKVADIYGPAQKNLNRTLKRALDPNGIIAPGKSGIFV
ncbi:4-cresol dehydrogenase [Bradyrhizobium macuxiense]|uniref:4-cresol dehydrogenase n=1 Tax=Bradyrhizobium macuxiense TaxID=1755647 RepID=A0A109JGJ7_9BRAD|nr:FAD-binding oxidoreductase [Bradyrhizobium macuxiense]KWV48481.1 4-cresol dehydrogenase [Bradyrhizobium macuxiense]